jgi:hypothetical protein
MEVAIKEKEFEDENLVIFVLGNTVINSGTQTYLHI